MKTFSRPTVGVVGATGAVGTTMVAPDAFVEAVVEVVIFQMFEFGAGGGKQLFDDFDMIVHRSADIEKHQHFDRVAPFRSGLNIEVAMFRR